MPMENQLAHAITQTEYDSSYDKAAKKLLANKQILAQIMKNCVNEYSAYDEILIGFPIWWYVAPTIIREVYRRNAGSGHGWRSC